MFVDATGAASPQGSPVDLKQVIGDSRQVEVQIYCLLPEGVTQLPVTTQEAGLLKAPN